MTKRNNLRILIFGRPGSGKTTLSVRMMKKALRRGEYVYSNIKITWLGDLLIVNKTQKIFNFLFSFLLSFSIPFLKRKKRKLLKKIEKLKDRKEKVVYDDDEIPSDDLTFIFVQQFLSIKACEVIDRVIKLQKYGPFKSHYYPPERYQFLEEIDVATTEIIKHATEYPNTYHGMYWDEGFVDLDHSQGVSSNTTNFFNQSRKLNVDCVISSQRPVAVYPSFRALVDYMLLVKRIPFLGIFLGFQFFVDDDANALPDLSTDVDGHNKGKLKYIWRGKYIFPYFATRQSIGLTKLITKAIK